MDFFTIAEKHTKNNPCLVYPNFIYGSHVKDLMIRGNAFYAVWDPDVGLWSKNPFCVASLVDRELFEYAEKYRTENDAPCQVASLKNDSSGSWRTFTSYVKLIDKLYQPLDSRVIFSNTEVTREDYASFKLPYPLIDAPCPNYNHLMDVLYDEAERDKLEWAIGAIISGEAKRIQKFIVLYGDAGSGKSTFLNIVEKLFAGYCAVFDAKALGSSNDQFSMEPFKENPLVGIQHDGDLSRIADNTRINSIVSHERMVINPKGKSRYEIKLDTFLFMGTNQPVKISDSKSGIIRRLIDVTPSGRKLSAEEYDRVVAALDYELSGIAWHCLQRFKEMGANYYSRYSPLTMMYQTDHFFNFMEDNQFIFADADPDGITLKRIWNMYTQYCTDSGIPEVNRYPMMKVKQELMAYFRNFDARKKIGGEFKRKIYSGFRTEKFSNNAEPLREAPSAIRSLQLSFSESIIDDILADCPAQYANADGKPIQAWDNVTTTLKDLDTTRLHYVRPPLNHIVIDFDLKNEAGEKDAALNLVEAAKLPPTYAEFSQGGNGIHLHYIWEGGDPLQLSALYAPNIEIKVFNGKSSLRRRVSYCNNLEIAHLTTGLPLKEEKKVVNFEGVANEKKLRELIERNLRKEIHADTSSSINFIDKLLEDAYNSGMVYDVRDMRPKILAFANNATNQSIRCITVVSRMKFCSEREPISSDGSYSEEDPIVFFDLEVFPNLLIICWKTMGEGHQVVRMINPSPQEVESLMRLKLVGFNNRRYDNHILYARYLGWSNAEIYELSRRLVGNSQNATFREAYNLSYADIYEFSSVKQSLKKFEIELGIHHLENAYPWDEPLAEEHWNEVADYCCNDVEATEATFNARYSDFVAQEILADLTGMPVNSNGNSMVARLIFGNNRKPELVYTDLATGEASNPKYQRKDIITAFPGYEFTYDPVLKKSKNMYRGTDVGFGGYVYAEPGMYTNVALIDIASLHPHSMIAMNYFGEYTELFAELVEARVCIKHKDYDRVKKLFGGKLAKYVEDDSKIGDLAYSLKTVINKIYGLTSAGFENEFRDNRNKNNIVALRGALFMRTLQDEVTARGFKVVHLKTDSAKIPNATPEIIQFCMDFAKKYGYTFEHEATYDRMCLTNDTVYIAKYMDKDKCQAMYGYIPEKNAKKSGKWTATGAQFAQPFVYKTLFTKEAIDFKDLCETKQVTSSLYLDYNEKLPDVSIFEKELTVRNKPDDGSGRLKKRNAMLAEWTNEQLAEKIEEGHNRKFVGRIGQFTPIQPGCGGGELVALRNGKYDSAVGAKGYRWLESEAVKIAGLEDKVDLSFYRKLVDAAKAAISKYGDFEWFVNNDDPPSEMNHPLDPDDVPWLMPCGDPSKTVCEDCEDFWKCAKLAAEKSA